MGIASCRALLCAVALVAAGPLAAQQVTLAASSWMPASHALSQSLVRWCDEVAQATARRVSCRMLPKAVAAPPGTFDAVREGLADIAYSVHGYTPGRYTLTQLAELPFAGDSAEVTSVAYQRIFERHLARLGEHRGLKVLAVFTHGPGQLFTARRPVDSIGDLRGMKLRADGGMVVNVGKAIGANVALQPAAEAPELLASGAIDGCFAPAESIESLQLGKLVRYRAEFPGGLYNTSFAFVMNQATWRRISASDQQAIDALSGEHAARLFGRAWDRVDRRANAVMQTHGVLPLRASRAFVEEVRTRTAPLEARWIADAKAKGLERPEQVLREYRAEVSRLQ